MVPFNLLYKEYEETKDVCDFYRKYGSDKTSTRFLLIRSLAKKDLKEIISGQSLNSNSDNIKDLTKEVYYSGINVSELLSYIESKRKDLIVTRQNELDKLPELLEEIPIVKCGVRNDNINDIVKRFVRNKQIKTGAELTRELNDVLDKVRQYCLWSYYNQTSNDIIELYFLKHRKIIPTLRKIHDIDFFLNLGGNIIPFDLKFTHISDDYFNLVSEGIKRAPKGSNDDFIEEEPKHESELNILRDYYRTYRNKQKNKNMPVPSKLTKVDLVNYIQGFHDAPSQQFLYEVQKQHSQYVPSSSQDLRALEWWNYKYQGERLFCNNNRFFVFISYKNQFADGRELKGKTQLIGNNITNFLNNMSINSIHEIHYHYDKEVSLAGDYTALALSTIYSE